ncbi:glycosyltransferase family 4 protein [Phenylobacterium terrae]|uniref:Glycosyltransferase family 4 protein n=1 Tax=Phenylobacterium terrae TaxID=2665495 RepID=A0ABW4N6R0_9CAUL
MKIAQVSPLCEAVPPKLYGGTERVVAHLTDALVRLGHDVTLFAAADARTSANLVACRDQAIRLDPAPLCSDVAAHLNMLAEVRERASEFDVIHFHTDLLHFPFFADRPRQTLTTLHGRLDLKDLPEAYARWSAFPLVSISNAQRRHLPGGAWAGTVYHGLEASMFHPSLRSEGYLAFLGRISPEKRPDRAIEIAQRLGRKLKIAAKVDAVDKAYFEEKIEPLILGQPMIEFIGEISDAEKSDFLGGADALLFPIDWPEPFGLVMIEAMACGTPVIAFDAGSTREVIEPGVTGFVVRSIDEAIQAVRRVEALDRHLVRRRFEARFTSDVMARAYVDLYTQRLPAAHPKTFALAAGA